MWTRFFNKVGKHSQICKMLCAKKVNSLEICEAHQSHFQTSSFLLVSMAKLSDQLEHECNLRSPSQETSKYMDCYCYDCIWLSEISLNVSKCEWGKVTWY